MGTPSTPRCSLTTRYFVLLPTESSKVRQAERFIAITSMVSSTTGGGCCAALFVRSVQSSTIRDDVCCLISTTPNNALSLCGSPNVLLMPWALVETRLMRTRRIHVALCNRSPDALRNKSRCPLLTCKWNDTLTSSLTACSLQSLVSAVRGFPPEPCVLWVKGLEGFLEIWNDNVPWQLVRQHVLLELRRRSHSGSLMLLSIVSAAKCVPGSCPAYARTRVAK